MAKVKNYSRTIGVFFNQATEARSSNNSLIVPELVSMGFNVVVVSINPDGLWKVSEMSPDVSGSGKIEKNDSQKNYDWSLHLNSKGVLQLSRPTTLSRQFIDIDIVMPAFSDDLALQQSIISVAEAMRVQYIGPSASVLALLSDAVLAYDVMKTYDVPIVPFVFFSAEEWSAHEKAFAREVINEVGFPARIQAFVGSQVVLSDIITNRDVLETSVTNSLKNSERLIITPADTGNFAVKVFVMGNYTRPHQIQVAVNVVGGVITASRKQSTLSASLSSRLEKIAKQAFLGLEGAGMLEFDVIINSAGTILFRNVSACPDNYAMSVWADCDITPEQLFRELVRLSDENNQSIKSNGK